MALFPNMFLQDVEGDGKCWLYSFCVGLISQANTAEELKRLMEVLRRTEVGRWLLDVNRLVTDTNQPPRSLPATKSRTLSELCYVLRQAPTDRFPLPASVTDSFD